MNDDDETRDGGRIFEDYRTRPSLCDVNLSNLTNGAEPPQRYIIDPILPRGHVTLLGGHGGSGKSILSMTWGAFVACGFSWWRLPVECGRALYLTLEDPDDLVRRRTRRIVEANRLSATMIEERLRALVLDRDAVDDALAIETNFAGVRGIKMTPLFDELVAASEGRDFVIIDNASDAYGGDENQRRQVRAFMRALARHIAWKQNAAVLLLAHLDKNAAKFGATGNSYSGSTAWHNSPRSRLALVTDDAGLQLVHEKNNLDPKLDEPIGLVWTSTGVLMPATVESKSDDDVAQLQDDMSIVLDVIRIAIANGTMVPAALSGPATALHALDPYAEFEPLRGKDGKQRTRAAIVGLLREGKLARHEYEDRYRNTRERLELTPSALVDVPNGARN